MSSSDDHRPQRPTDSLPLELETAFAASPKAREAFEQLPPSHRREYIGWVRSGRRDDVRERRAAQAVMRLLSDPAGAVQDPGADE